MTALERALHRGDYRHFQESIWDFRINRISVDDIEPCRRFLVRIMSRAVLDVCMYPEDNDNHFTAREWLLGNVDSEISLSDIAELVELDFLQDQIFSLAEEEGVDREKVRDMKRLLYNYDDGRAGPAS